MAQHRAIRWLIFLQTKTDSMDPSWGTHEVLGLSLCLSGSQFPHLQNGNSTVTIVTVLWEDTQCRACCLALEKRPELAVCIWGFHFITSGLSACISDFSVPAS